MATLASMVGDVGLGRYASPARGNPARGNPGERGVRQDAKGGDGDNRFATSRGFLATDRVPDTIFGIPVVASEDRYTKVDLDFFRKHPEAGGYYDMGDGEGVEDGSSEGAPVQDDAPRQYKVRRGDTASKIAREHGVDLTTFAKWNGTGVKGLDKIRPGQLLWVAGPYPGPNRNPGNVKNRGNYEGRDPKHKGKFAKFDTPEHGLNAAARVVDRLAADLQATGLTNATPFSVISRYAPASDGNDPEEHARNIVGGAGVGLYDRLHDMSVKQKAGLLRGLTRFETSKEASDWFRQADYETAAGLIDVAPPPERAANEYGGNMSPEDVKPLLVRDKDGKITEYMTTHSIVRSGVGDQEGMLVVIPQVVRGKELSAEDAYDEYRMTGLHWGSAKTAEEADALAQRVHEDEARRWGPWWNAYIEEHPDELSEKLKAEIEKSREQEEKNER